ncbi:NPCBM/NEW2 domain-containing protein [Planctomycetota bacterium]
MTRHIPTDKLNMWLMQLVQGDISNEDLMELEGAMADDLEILDYCLEYLIITAGLEWVGREKEDHGTDHIVKTLQKVHKQSLRKARPQLVTWTARFAAMVVLGLGVAFLVQRGLQQPQVQKLTAIVNERAAKWDDPVLSAGAGTPIGLGEKHLLQGLAEVRMASGAQLILKGPCRFSMEGANLMRLVRGVVTAKVPQEARGFTIRTQFVNIVDLGTEFGIIAKGDGSIETHVISGEIELQRAPGAPPVVVGRSFPEGLAVTVDNVIGVKAVGGANEMRFVRELPSQGTGAIPGQRFDLADVVGIGNGYGTGTLGCGINPNDGAALHSPVLTGSAPPQAGYGFLLNWRYVDGVFVPNGDRKDNAVTSTLDFPNCPQTLGSAKQGINNGGLFALPNGQRASYKARLQGKDYGTPERPALGIHPNAGITFDLDRIRMDHPGVAITAFQAQCGISETAPKAPAAPVEFWVLVDGVVVFQHKVMAQQLATGAVRVPLAKGDRFLTLATTCSGATDYCWALFAEPYLMMQTDD